MNNYIQWCIEQHRNTNHMYDKYLPYEFHLRMVVNVYEDFKHLLSEHLFKRKVWVRGDHDPVYISETEETINKACWGHDLIEDCRKSYNDCKENLGEYAAEIIYAVSNEKGKNRAERGNKKYYEGIRNTPGATFIKLCDRIANTQYSKMSKSSMYDMYKKENPRFINWVDAKAYLEMREYLIKLFEP